MNKSVAHRPSVLMDLYARPYAYDFFQAVRLLNSAAHYTDKTEHTYLDVVRFKTLLSLSMPASAIYSLQAATPSIPPVMTITFIGLTGPSGALPMRYTEMLLERRFQYKDETSHHFFDMFSHRFTSLFYQAWQKNHIFVACERNVRQGFLPKVLSLVGLGTQALRHRLVKDGVDDQLFAFYAGRFAQKHRSAEGLAAILSQQFCVPIKIHSFYGAWLRLAKEDLFQLGVNHCTLGHAPMVGNRVWDCQTKFRICIGPLKRDRFNDFLPTGKAYRSLVSVVKFCVGPALRFDLQLILDRKQVPGCVLGGKREGAGLGWASWLNRSHAHVFDADQVVLEGQL